MHKLTQWLIKELTKMPETKKLSFQQSARRFLAGFFIIMILLTFISRSADSVTIARVTADSVKSGKLTYEVEGTGMVKENTERYLNLYTDIRIGHIFVKSGQSVKKGEEIFQYNINDLKKKLTDLETEIKKAEINMQINQLSSDEVMPDSEKKTAELVLNRAELDLKTAEKDFILAKKEVNTEKKEACEEAEKAYNQAEETYQQQERERDRQIKAADKNIKKAKRELEKAYRKKTDTENVLNDYRNAAQNKENEAIEKAQTRIFIQYYGETEYENHMKAVDKAEESVDRAEQDYKIAKREAQENDTSLNDSQKATYKRAISDAEEELNELTKKDTELSDAILSYRIALQNNIEQDINSTYTNLFSLLYKEDDETKQLIYDADDKLSEAKEAYQDKTEEWQEIMEDEKEKVDEAMKVLNKAEDIYDQIKNHTYDYSKDIKEEEKMAENAKRSVEDAKISLEQTEKNEAETVKKNNNSREIANLNKELNEIDIRKKEKEVKAVTQLITSKGKVLSPEDGVIHELGIETGNTITGTEKVSIAYHDFGFEAKITKEEAKHLEAGDEIKIYIGNNEKEITFPIENISPEDSEGKFTITGILPDGDYTAIQTVSFKINKQSKLYEQTIPIEALRMDTEGRNYILLYEEKNTVLGNQLTAVRMDVNVLDKDYKTAAITSILEDNNNLIINSNKLIEEGDRVRVVSNED